MNNEYPDPRPYRLLAALVAGHIVVNIVWLAMTSSVDIGLPHNHLYQALAHALDIDGARPWGNPHSYLYAFSALGVRMLGPSYLSVTLVHSMFFALAIVAVFLLGRDLAGPWGGLTAAALFSLTPAAYGMSRLFGDLPLATAITAWCMWALWRAGRGGAWGWALCGALILAGVYGLLVPSNAALIGLALLGPFCVALPTAYRRSRRAGRVAIVVVLGLLAGGALLQVVGGGLFESYYFKESARFAEASLWRHPRFAIAQLVLLGGYVLGPLLFVALAAATVIAFARQAEGRWVLLAGVVLPLLVLTIVPKRKDLNLFAILPAITVLTAIGLMQLRRARVIVVGLLTLALVSFFWHSFTPRQPTRMIDRLGLAAALEAPPYPWVTAPHRDPQARRVAVMIRDNMIRRRPTGEIAVLSLECTSDDTLRFELALMERRMRLLQLCEEENPAAAWRAANCLLIPSGAPPPAGAEKIAAAASYGLFTNPNAE